MKLNLTLGLLCHIQLFDKQGFNNKGACWISSSKTKKTFFIVIPAGGKGAGLCESRNLRSR